MNTRIGNSTRNRPAALADGVGAADAAFVEDALTKMTSTGADPLAVADLVLDAVHTGQFLIPTSLGCHCGWWQLRYQHPGLSTRRAVAGLVNMQPAAGDPGPQRKAYATRLRPARCLGWETVPVTVITLENAEDVLKAEADENTCRKDLTPVEAERAARPT